MSRDGLGECRFAGAVRAHYSVDFATFDREREALDDLFFADGDVEILISSEDMRKGLSGEVRMARMRRLLAGGADSAAFPRNVISTEEGL
jgi:hypothetical protein